MPETADGCFPPLPEASLPPPQSRPRAPRIQLPTQTLRSHGFNLLTSPASHARFHSSKSYFAIPARASAASSLTPSHSESERAANDEPSLSPDLNPVPAPAADLGSGVGSDLKKSGRSFPHCPVAAPVRRPVGSALAPTFARRASNLNFSVSNVPVDFVLPLGTLAPTTEAFWGHSFPGTPPSNVKASRSRRRTKKEADGGHVPKSSNATPTPRVHVTVEVPC